MMGVGTRAWCEAQCCGRFSSPPPPPNEKSCGTGIGTVGICGLRRDKGERLQPTSLRLRGHGSDGRGSPEGEGRAGRLHRAVRRGSAAVHAIVVVPPPPLRVALPLPHDATECELWRCA